MAKDRYEQLIHEFLAKKRAIYEAGFELAPGLSAVEKSKANSKYAFWLGIFAVFGLQGRARVPGAALRSSPQRVGQRLSYKASPDSVSSSGDAERRDPLAPPRGQAACVGAKKLGELTPGS